MTHQREAVVVVGASRADDIHVTHADASFAAFRADVWELERQDLGNVVGHDSRGG